MKRIREIYIPKPAKVPEGGPTGGEWSDVETATAPLVTGAPSNRYYATFRSGVLTWAKRTNSVVVEDEGGIAAAVAALGGISGRKEMIFSGIDPQTVPNAGFTVPADTSVFARGSRGAVLTAPVGATGTALMVMNHSSGYMRSRIEGIEIDLNGHATMVNGIQATGNNTAYKDISIVDCIVRNALGKGVWTWQSNGILIENMQVIDCFDGIYIDQPVGFVRIVNPRIINTVAGRMRFGIRAHNTSPANPEADLEIIGAYVDGATYATTNGSEAHGISISKTPRYAVIGGRVTRCGNPANNEGGGLVIAGSHEGSVSDFSACDNYGNGIWSELEPSADTTIGSAGQQRGAKYTNVTTNNNDMAGMSGSYGAGTKVVNFEAFGNGKEGIVWDCERFILTGFTVANNWQNTGASAPGQNGGAKAGVRSYDGGRSIITNGEIYDNQAVKTQYYGLAVEQRANVIANVITLDADHITGGFTESGGSTANVKTNVITT